MADKASAPGLILVEARKGGHPGLIFTRPFYLYKDGTRNYSEEMEHLLDAGQMEI